MTFAQIAQRLQYFIYLTPSRPSIASIYDVIICRIQSENLFRKSLGQTPLEIPHRSTIYRQIQQLDPIDKKPLVVMVQELPI